MFVSVEMPIADHAFRGSREMVRGPEAVDGQAEQASAVVESAAVGPGVKDHAGREAVADQPPQAFETTAVGRPQPGGLL